MIQFNRENRTFTITLSGDYEDYFSYLRPLTRFIATQSPDLLDATELYYIINLLEGMLPASSQHLGLAPIEQIVSIEDATYLKNLKKQNNNTVKQHITEKE